MEDVKYNPGAMSQAPFVTPVNEVIRRVDDFFMETGAVHRTLRKLAERLPQEQISYAVIRGMALALHGLVRPTQDVDLLLTPDGLEASTGIR